MSIRSESQPIKDRWEEHYDGPVVRRILFELCFYLLFLINVSIISYAMAGSSKYYMSDMMTKLFVDKAFDGPVDNTELTFRDLTTTAEFWHFACTLLLDAIFDDDTDTGLEDRNFNDTSMFLGDVNVLLGPPRLRQLRVKNASCTIHELFQHNFRDCYSDFASSSNDLHAFGSHNGIPWIYSQDDGLPFWGILHSYPGGGYCQDFKPTKIETLHMLQELRPQWIDAGTRVVFIEFSIYNANVNMFCLAKLIAEFPPTGGILTSYSFRSVKLLRFFAGYELVILLCECLFLAQVIWYTVVEVLQLWHRRCSYFKSFWNILDLTIVLISYTSLSFSVYRYIHIKSKIDSHQSEPHRFVNLDVLVYFQVQYNDFMAICVFLAWIKVVKYMRFNKTLRQFSTALERCATDLLGFGFMFLIVFIAFAQLGYILFGMENENFRTYGDSVLTLLRAVLGDFDYLAIEKANRILGPIFFVIYIFFVFFVLLNMFLAIINDTYSEVKAEETQRIQVHLGFYIKQQLLRLLQYCPARVKTLTKCSKIVATEAEKNSAQQWSNERKTESKEYGLEDIFEPITASDHYVNQTVESLTIRIQTLEVSLDAIVDKLNQFIYALDQHNECHTSSSA